MNWTRFFSQIWWCGLAAAYALTKSTTPSPDTERSPDSLILASHHTPLKPSKTNDMNELDPSLYQLHEEVKCDDRHRLGVSHDQINREHKLCCFFSPLMVDQPCLNWFYWVEHAVGGGWLLDKLTTDLQNSKYLEHCRQTHNIYCCADAEDGSLMDAVGIDCEAAVGYRNNQEFRQMENSHEKHHAVGHGSHREVTHTKAKIRVQNKPPTPDKAMPVIKILEFDPRVPSQYRR